MEKKNKGSSSSYSYNCEKCRDTGWILEENKNSAPLARSCTCREINKLRAQWKAAGIDPEKCHQSFAGFQVWNATSKKAKNAAIAYYKDFENIKKNRKNSIMFCGQPGSGKTHLTVALAINLLNKQTKVVYMPYRDVITRLKQNVLDCEYYKKIIARYQTCEVLLLDDLFKGKLTETDINLMFELINYRYLNHLPIIVSTEFTVDKLLSFDEAIGSRIYEMCKDFIVEIERGRDNNYRLRA